MNRIVIAVIGLAALAIGVWFTVVDRVLMGGACIGLGIACLVGASKSDGATKPIDRA